MYINVLSLTHHVLIKSRSLLVHVVLKQNVIRQDVLVFLVFSACSVTLVLQIVYLRKQLSVCCRLLNEQRKQTLLLLPASGTLKTLYSFNRSVNARVKCELALIYYPQKKTIGFIKISSRSKTRLAVFDQVSRFLQECLSKSSYMFIIGLFLDTIQDRQYKHIDILGGNWIRTRSGFKQFCYKIGFVFQNNYTLVVTHFQYYNHFVNVG